VPPAASAHVWDKDLGGVERQLAWEGRAAAVARRAPPVEGGRGEPLPRQMRPAHIALGAIAFGLGLLGVYDEYFVVVEFLKGALQPATAFIGLVAVIAGMARLRPKAGHIVFGLVLLALSIYGFYDEYYAVLDFLKGAVPVAMVGVGCVAVASGVNRLR